MSEWSMPIKVCFVCFLIAGIISIAIEFVIIGEIFIQNINTNISNVLYSEEELLEFDGIWLDKESSFNLACNCINKPVLLKINTLNSGIIDIDLSAPNIRKNIEKNIDRERFRIKVSEIAGYITVFLDKG